MSPMRNSNRLRPTSLQSKLTRDRPALCEVGRSRREEILMDTTTIEQRLRTFLLALAGFMCLGTVAELALAEHTKTLVQLTPFVLCGVGLVTVIVALLRPRRETLIALRVVMGLLMAGSLFGIYEHLANN